MYITFPSNIQCLMTKNKHWDLNCKTTDKVNYMKQLMASLNGNNFVHGHRFSSASWSWMLQKWNIRGIICHVPNILVWTWLLRVYCTPYSFFKTFFSWHFAKNNRGNHCNFFFTTVYNSTFLNRFLTSIYFGVRAESEVTRVVVSLTTEEVEFVYRGCHDTRSLMQQRHDTATGQVHTTLYSSTTTLPLDRYTQN